MFPKVGKHFMAYAESKSGGATHATKLHEWVTHCLLLDGPQIALASSGRHFKHFELCSLQGRLVA